MKRKESDKGYKRWKEKKKGPGQAEKKRRQPNSTQYSSMLVVRDSKLRG